VFKRVSPETNEKPTGGESGESRQILLVVLLVVVSLIGYLYFFTGLLKPREEAVTAPAEQTALVRKPIPPRFERPEEKAAAPKTEEKKPSPEKEVTSAAGEESRKAKAPGQQNIKQVSAPATEPVKTAKIEGAAVEKGQAKPAPATAAPAKPQVKKETKPSAAASGKVTAKRDAKQERAPQKVAKGKRAACTLMIGDYADEEVKRIEARLKKSAITPVRKQSGNREEPMHRLFLAEFADSEAARAEFEKLEKLTGDAFILRENSKYAVYAGSYLRGGRAAKERDRLHARGIKTILKNAEVKVHMTRVTAGSFSGREEAHKEAQRLRKLGITARVTCAD
jgi:hypothetical protein